MVRIIKAEGVTADKQYIEAAGLYTDTKPLTGVVTGSLFLEVDTGDVYAFDEVTNGGEWDKIAALGGDA